MRNSVRHADFACLLSPHHKSLSTKLLAMSSRQTVRGGRQFWTVSKASTVWTRQLVQVCALTGPRAGRTRRGGPAVPAPQAGGCQGCGLGSAPSSSGHPHLHRSSHCQRHLRGHLGLFEKLTIRARSWL